MKTHHVLPNNFGMNRVQLTAESPKFILSATEKMSFVDPTAASCNKSGKTGNFWPPD